jgi:hypothetical protein
MKPAAYYSLITLAILVLAAPVILVLAVNAALSAHGKEDKIIFGSKEIEEGIAAFIQKRGAPPQALADLVPDVMRSIPAFPEVSKIDYHLSPTGREWTLDLYRTQRKVPLVYRRTNASLSPEDALRKVDVENGCYVLKAR